MFGAHLSFAKPLVSILYEMDYYKLDTFQIFLRNNRNMKRRAIMLQEVNDFNIEIIKRELTEYVVHAPYSMNLCRGDVDSFNRNVSILREDFQLMKCLAGTKIYVVHPGSHLGLSPTEALRNIIKHFEAVRDDIGSTIIAVETMSGAGTQALSNPSEVEMFMCLAIDIPNISICFDTCHVFASGYQCDETFDRLKQYVSVIHLNDSKGTLGSFLDRHMNLSYGNIPMESIRNAISINSVYKDVPVILETPADGFLSDIALYRNMML